MSFLVDANVLSEATRPKPNRAVLQFLADNETALYLSAITIGEIQKGISLYPHGRKRRVLKAWFEELLDSFVGRILPLDQAIAIEWGQLYADLKKNGQTPSSFDSLLMATASHYGLTIVTRNAADFRNIPVPLLNPWD